MLDQVLRLVGILIDHLLQRWEVWIMTLAIVTLTADEGVMVVVSWTLDGLGLIGTLPSNSALRRHAHGGLLGTWMMMI